MNSDWKYVPFSDLFQWADKSSIKSGDGKTVGKYKMFVCSDTEVKRFDEYLEDKPSLVFGTGGKASCHIVAEPFAYSTDCAVAHAKSDNTYLKFYYYYLRKDRLGDLQETFTGSGLQHTSKKKIDKILVPSIATDEQKRIVARIEEMFSQLDAGVDTLKKTKAQLAVYRQAVLKEAFESVSGECCRIRDVCKEIKVGIVIKPTQYYVDSDGVFAFRNGNVRRGYIDDSDLVMISRDGHEKNKKSEVHKGDVLISRSGANLGMASPVPEKYNGFNAIDVVIAVPDHRLVLPTYLAHYTNSPDGRSVVKNNERGAAQGHLNVTVYGQLPITIPTKRIQQAIVAEIDGKLSVCGSIEKTVDTALLQAEVMRQSILKESFERRI